MSELFDTETVYTARVKWFNNRSGYGFATVLGGPSNGEDIFVHHSGINVANEQYKYLVQGEYVQFNLRPSENKAHPFQADNICGIHKGPLMCETHLQIKRGRAQKSDYEGDEGEYRRRRRTVRPHGAGPRDSQVRHDSEENWKLVGKKKTEEKLEKTEDN